jgi:nucleoside-diphosphate-sugar epimerase
MRICLVGGLGTLGADIVDAYKTRHELLIIDDGLESCLAIDDLPPNVEVISANVSHQENYKEALIEFTPEMVIYLATTVSADQKRGFESVLGLSNICEIGSMTSNFPILYIQSFLTRDVSKPVNSNSPVSPGESYGTWKMAGEYLLQAYSGKKTSVILSSVVSPRISVGAIPAFTKRILAGEDLTVTDTYRDYLTPADFILFLDAAIALDTWPSECAVGSAKAISTKEVAEFVAGALNVSLDSFNITVNPPKNTDPRYVIFDIEETEKIFGWKPVGNIYNAIESCVNTIKSSNQQLRLHH